MPTNARLRTRFGSFEVAARYGLRADIPRALRRYGAMTTVEIANKCYWDRSPTNFRLGARWWANHSQMSATRRAIAVLKNQGVIASGGRRGRRPLYDLAIQFERI